MSNSKPTRADKVRQRRAKRNQKNTSEKLSLKERWTRSRRQANYPPAVMRGGKAIVPLQPRRKTIPRRRYDIALGRSGSELRLPPVPTMRPTWRLISGALTVGLLALLWYLWHAPQYVVQAAAIEGTHQITDRDINQLLGLGETPIFALHPVEMRSRLLKAFPEFSQVDVSLELPNRVIVVVEEQVPVLLWQHANGIVAVNDGGVSFPARGEYDSLPIVEAPKMVPAPVTLEEGEVQPIDPFVSRQLISPDMVQAVLLLQDTIPEETVLLFDPEYGLGWRDPQGWDVFFGHEVHNITEKIRVYNALVSKLLAEGTKPEFISVEFLHAPYYRMDR